VFILALVAAASLLRLHPEVGALLDSAALQHWLAGYGRFSALAFLLLSVAGVAAGVPRIIFALAGGALFGFVNGTAYALVSAVAGSAIAWQVVRRCRRDPQRFPNTGKVPLNLTGEIRVFDVYFVRQIPLNGMIANIALAFSKVSFGRFVLGTFIGYIPQTVIATLAGSGIVGEENHFFLIELLGFSIFLQMLIWFSLIFWRSPYQLAFGRWRRSQGPSGAYDAAAQLKKGNAHET